MVAYLVLIMLMYGIAVATMLSPGRLGPAVSPAGGRGAHRHRQRYRPRRARSPMWRTNSVWPTWAGWSASCWWASRCSPRQARHRLNDRSLTADAVGWSQVRMHLLLLSASAPLVLTILEPPVWGREDTLVATAASLAMFLIIIARVNSPNASTVVYSTNERP